MDFIESETKKVPIMLLNGRLNKVSNIDSFSEDCFLYLDQLALERDA